MYNSLFLEIAPHVKSEVETSIARLGEGGINMLNLAVPKPEIPADIALNYKQVCRRIVNYMHARQAIYAKARLGESTKWP